MKLKNRFIKLKQSNRLYDCSRPLVGITGGIASGKSTVCQLLKDQGLCVIDADRLVKNIYKKPEVIEFIQLHFPDTIEGTQINFKSLRKIFFENAQAKREIEALIYSHLPEEFREATRSHPEAKVIFYDVPLLFEKHLESFCDLVVTVYIPKSEQKMRLIQRDQISEELAEIILNQQIDIEEKKQRSDVVLKNTSTPDRLKDQVNQFVNDYLE